MAANWRLAKSLVQLQAEVNDFAPRRSKKEDGTIGDASHAGQTSDHNPCKCHDVVCAIDFTHDPVGGFNSYKFAEWLRRRVAFGNEPRIKYVISDGLIFSGPHQAYEAGQWRKYSGSNKHDQHVHISVRHGPEEFDDQGKWWVVTGMMKLPPPTKVCPTCGQKLP